MIKKCKDAEIKHLNDPNAFGISLVFITQAIELRKKLGYNHDYIMVREETSIAEKIKKTFSFFA